jgi:probable rRNA maturation factor
MDELRPPTDGEEPPVGLLGDIVLCPEVADRQAGEHRRSTTEEEEYLLVHGLLHLLGYDHAEPDEQAEMFGLTDKIISTWAVQRPDRARGT